METFASPVLLLAILAGILALGAIVVSRRTRPARRSRIAVAAAVLPALVMIALFYSLAIHMHQVLGAWPASIGERGFTASLMTHASIATNVFIILTLVNMFAWPVAVLLCLLIRRLRVCVYYLCVYAFACLVCFGAMLLAPSQFLNWWWD